MCTVACLVHFLSGAVLYGNQFYLKMLSKMAVLVSTVIKDAFIALSSRGCLMAG